MYGLGVRSQIGYLKFGQVINGVLENRSITEPCVTVLEVIHNLTECLVEPEID